MAAYQLAEVESEKGMERRVGAVGQIGAGQMGHVLIVALLAVRVDIVTAPVAAQIAVECRADVIKLVEERDQFLVEALIQKARQTERHQVEHLMAIDKVALHLESDAAALAGQAAVAKPQWSNPRLQAMRVTVPCLRDRDQ